MSDPRPESDPSKTTPLSVASAGGSSIGGKPPSLEDTVHALQAAAKEGTSVDTLIARLVVDQGLATREEVAHCFEKSKGDSGDVKAKSLAQLLVDNEFVTSRQLSRLRQIVEAQRSGQQIPGFQLLGELGSGAMAKVYKARQLSLNRLVAIKVLPKRYSQNPQFIERFYAEGRAAAALNHPNIVQAFDVGKAGEHHYFVMEYVDGRTVHDDIVQHKRFSEQEAIEVITQVTEALEHAHERGLIHRDVKPKNVMITKEGVVKLADMGLARAMTDEEAAKAEEGKAFGTPYYISPEQIKGEREIGPPADIYSLGATLYHMVTGNVPFDAKSPSAVMHKHLKADLVPPDHVNPKLSAGISEVIEMMMAKNPGHRYRSCKDLLVDLKAIKKGETPPIAHKDVLPADDLKQLVEAETAAAAAEIPADASGAASGGGWMVPALVVLGLLLLVSVTTNLVLMLS